MALPVTEFGIANPSFWEDSAWRLPPVWKVVIPEMVQPLAGAPDPDLFTMER